MDILHVIGMISKTALDIGRNSRNKETDIAIVFYVEQIELVQIPGQEKIDKKIDKEYVVIRE